MTESGVFIENGEVRTIFSDEIERTGYMSVEECAGLLHEMVDKTRDLLKQNADKNCKKSA
jgi:hypothetical protein